MATSRWEAVETVIEPWLDDLRAQAIRRLPFFFAYRGGEWEYHLRIGRVIFSNVPDVIPKPIAEITEEMRLALGE